MIMKWKKKVQMEGLAFVSGHSSFQTTAFRDLQRMLKIILMEYEIFSSTALISVVVEHIQIYALDTQTLV